MVNKTQSLSFAPTPHNEKQNDDSKESVLLLLSSEFDRLNATYFDSRLRAPTIEFSTRKTYGGYYQKNKHRIVLSWQAYVEHGLDETTNTFRHEVAHIVHQNHRQEFWNLAIKLGVSRKYAAAPLSAIRRRSRWYTYQCPSCHATVQRRRKIHISSSCSKCDTEYNPAYRLALVRTELR